MINLEKKLVLAEQNFTGNSLLTTGLWLMSKNMDSGLDSLVKAHSMLANQIK